jgi:hypothetical protein
VTTPLASAVAAWCDTKRVKLLRDDGHTDSAVVPPLLMRLRAAVGSNTVVHERSGGGGGSPVDLVALDLLVQLVHTAARWTAAAGLLPRPVGADGLRQLAVHHWPPDGPDPDLLADLLRRLAERAESHLSPPEATATRYVRDTPCPACGARSVAAGTNAHGEPTRTPAVAVEFHGGLVRYAWCQECGQQWPRDQLTAWAAEVT